MWLRPHGAIWTFLKLLSLQGSVASLHLKGTGDWQVPLTWLLCQTECVDLDKTRYATLSFHTLETVFFTNVHFTQNCLRSVSPTPTISLIKTAERSIQNIWILHAAKMYTDRFGMPHQIRSDTKSLSGSSTSERSLLYLLSFFIASVIFPNRFGLLTVVKRNAHWMAVKETVRSDAALADFYRRAKPKPV